LAPVPASKFAILSGAAITAPALFPLLYVLDMPSWMLVSRVRFPPWVLVILLIRVFARR